MTDTQTLNPEILNVTENVTFTPLELKYFVLELKDMMAEGKFDLPKVIHNARYLAELEISDKQFEEGHYIEFEDGEWDKFVDEQDFEVTIKGGYKIQIAWDDESKVWVATSKDIPGLILEDESSGILIQKAKQVAFELMELNGMSS
ncbi:MAG: DUF1902 domain-containing protein [Selenomonadaceae bacterium]|nr:DUF1902 domain-containing protein [Selenomonadaceae bacterium]